MIFEMEEGSQWVIWGKLTHGSGYVTRVAV